ncbi:MAG TPA: AI-2E family transporter [Gemmataceae bacterium]
MASTSTTKPRDAFLILGGLVLVTACLYWARQVLIPVALAVLLAFILTPAVSALQRRGLGRLPSVILVVLLALLLLSGVGYVISRQINNLVGNLDKYSENIVNKIQSLRGAGEGGFIGRVQQTITNISDELTQNAQEKQKQKEGKRGPAHTDEEGFAKKDGQVPGEEKPKPGEVPEKPVYVQTTPSGWSRVGEAVGPAAEGLGNAFLILVLVVFMLIQRENLRNRLVRLFGHGRLIVTTQAFDEGAQRISRFLLMQLLINAFFGVTLIIGLVLMGLVSGHRELWQYALLWGFLSCILRFVPYLGTWVAAALVVGFSIATLPGWGLPLGVFGFFLVVELLTANVIEPLLFGHSTGISPLALLLAAAFWTWLWGPIGLVLSTPLTVILVLLGKYVPEFHFFEVLLGDEPVLSRHVTYYQRLVARDLDEASDLVESYMRDHSPEQVYEEVLLPALLLAKKDRERGELEAENYEFVLQGIRDIQEDLPASWTENVKPAAGASKVVALGCPGRDEADELALKMLAELVRLSGYTLEIISSTKLSAEVLEKLQQANPTVVCIGSLPPGGLSQARYLCKRIRQQAPDVKIVVGRWGEKEQTERMEARLCGAGADRVATTLHETRAQIVPLLQVAANIQAAGGAKPSELITTP